MAQRLSRRDRAASSQFWRSGGFFISNPYPTHGIPQNFIDSKLSCGDNCAFQTGKNLISTPRNNEGE